MIFNKIGVPASFQGEQINPWAWGFDSIIASGGLECLKGLKVHPNDQFKEERPWKTPHLVVGYISSKFRFDWTRYPYSSASILPFNGFEMHLVSAKEIRVWTRFPGLTRISATHYHSRPSRNEDCWVMEILIGQFPRRGPVFSRTIVRIWSAGLALTELFSSKQSYQQAGYQFGENRRLGAGESHWPSSCSCLICSCSRSFDPETSQLLTRVRKACATVFAAAAGSSAIIFRKPALSLQALNPRRDTPRSDPAQTANPAPAPLSHSWIIDWSGSLDLLHCSTSYVMERK